MELRVTRQNAVIIDNWLAIFVNSAVCIRIRLLGTSMHVMRIPCSRLDWMHDSGVHVTVASDAQCGRIHGGSVDG